MYLDIPPFCFYYNLSFSFKYGLRLFSISPFCFLMHYQHFLQHNLISIHPVSHIFFSLFIIPSLFISVSCLRVFSYFSFTIYKISFLYNLFLFIFSLISFSFSTFSFFILSSFFLLCDFFLFYSIFFHYPLSLFSNSLSLLFIIPKLIHLCLALTLPSLPSLYSLYLFFQE